VRATVVWNRRLSPGYLHLGIAAPGFPSAFRAGEFVMVRLPWVGDPLLPRAYSIYRVSPAGPDRASPPVTGPVIEILYKVVGKGTHTLAQMDPGQAIELLGPLGNGFSVPGGTTTTVLVAGGIGVPPISALAGQIGAAQSAERRAQSAAGRGRLEVFLGGKTAEDILCAADFKAVRAALHVATEDGSLGTRGLVTDLLQPFLAVQGAQGTQVYACGPPGMLEAVGRLAEAMGMSCQLSLEANMACGFGACMGCAVPIRGPEPRYKLCCTEGPVFEASEVAWG
jgi:dihydroorotate dehydrogenase electron transfer subunit